MEENEIQEIIKISNSLLSSSTTSVTNSSLSVDADNEKIAEAEEVLKSLAESTSVNTHMIIPLNEFIKDMYNCEDGVSIENSAISSSVVVDAIDLNGEINSVLTDSKGDLSYTNLDQPKTETFTMDASFLYENNANTCLYPVPPTTPVSPFQSQYQNTSNTQFFSYPNLPYNYGYNFIQQPNYVYSHHLQNNTSHNPLLISEASAFAPVKPKHFSPRLLNFENQNDNICQTVPPQKMANSVRNKKPFENIPSTSEKNIVSSPSTTQGVQLKEIQEIFANTPIPITMTSATTPIDIEPIVRFPLQTRATVSTSTISNENSNWISRLANYFDTSNIEIPMPSIPPKPKRNYRRKQKLETIDLNNNNEFFLQNIDTSVRFESQNKRVRKSSPTFVAIKNIEKEVDEIFRQRKKRRSAPVSKESDSDSDEIPLKLIKTHKCPNCKKMYKTPKTLSQHLKKCSPPAPVVSSTTETTIQVEVPAPMVIKEDIDTDDFKFVYCSDSDHGKAQMEKEDFFFQYNDEDSLDIKSETGSENDKALKRFFSSTQNISKTPSPMLMMPDETKSEITKCVVNCEDEDSIISVVN
ncbi:hypothetical protein ACFFRR_005621 [Megaselia abdita]